VDYLASVDSKEDVGRKMVQCAVCLVSAENKALELQKTVYGKQKRQQKCWRYRTNPQYYTKKMIDEE